MRYTNDQVVEHRTEDQVVDEVRPAGVNQLARVLALITGAIVLVLGVTAMVRIDWGSADLDDPQVTVADMTFTPVIATATVIIAILLIGAAAMPEGDLRLALGVVLLGFGAAVLLVDEMGTSWDLGDRSGWLAVSVGAVFVVTGLLTDGRQVVRRRYATHDEQLV
jgi:hypothetical protein